MNNNFFIYEPVEVPKVNIKLPYFMKDEVFDYAPRQLYEIEQSQKEESTPSDPFVSTSLTDIKSLPNISSFTNNNEQSKNKSNYNLDISFEQLIKLENLPVIITSGYRGAGDYMNGKTASGKRSNHNRLDEQGNPMAYDINPKPGYSFEDLRQIFYKNPRVVAWFNHKGWGILEERMDGRPGFYDIRGVYHGTKATGPHFHIGPDKYGVECFLYKTQVKKAAKGMKFDENENISNNNFFIYETVKPQKVKLKTSLFGDIDLGNDFIGITQTGIPIAKSNLSELLEDKMISSSSLEEQFLPEIQITKETPLLEISLLETSSQGLKSFSSLDTKDFKRYASGDYLNNINHNLKNRTINFNNIPKNFIDTIAPIAELTGVPLGFFIMVAQSESGFKNQKPNKDGYGGYFGQSVKNGVGYDKSLATQAMGVVQSYKNAQKASPGAQPKDLLTLGYIYHHLPAVGSKYWNYTGGNIYTLNPDLIYKNITGCYKGGSKTRYAEAIMVNVCAQYMAELIALHPELMN